ncbi:S8 family peptidase [Hyphomonas jannaschiana]|uniref:Subtilase family protein n=1 Tax=Hyphomonas jannaschiana VP2 TaxID=1280952 RepID=A0A059F803_9PROT|nr:S8 family peptidase [Hyphomonas jannaschiana]KCZ86678.1 subtilase family protein [Hyphomonas jannaschiana VP2]
MSNQSTKSARLLFGAALTSLLLVSACDRQGERLERAREIADASLKQISGETVVEQANKTDPMRSVPVEARAIAGKVISDISGKPTNKPAFAVLSVIAKPADIPPAEAMAEIDDGELFLEDETALADAMEEAPVAAAPAPRAPASRSLELFQPEMGIAPRVKLDPKAREQSLQQIEEATRALETTAQTQPAPLKKTRSLQPRSLESAPVEEQMAARKLARRSLVTRDAIVAQRDANAVMLDTLAKYKMNAEVTLSREGQMVIQVAGAGPTLFTPEDAKDPSLSFLAIDEGKGCPDPNDLDAIEADPVLATNCFVDDLRASGQFEYVEKDFIFENQFVRRPPEGSPSTSNGVTPSTGSTTPVNVEVTPNDPLWDLQWDMKPRGSGEGQSLGGAGFQDFWTRQGIEGSSDVVVAVVDTGLQMNHPDIAASANIAPGWDMVSDPRMGNDGDGRDSDPNDPGDLCNPAVPGAADSFHGTHVAGTIGAAASNNGAGVAGGAWNVKIVPVRALGKCGGRLSDINDAIRWAAGLIPAEGEDGSEVWNDNPADIINLSIGLFEYCPASLQDAIDSVTERGAVVVSAAGNARIDTAYYAPGGCDNVISVAAGNALGEITAYSNFGDGVDILAPGGEMARDDDNDSRPDGILSTKASTDCYDPVTGEAVQDCYYAYEQGTSMAAPHVSAALALLKARDPEASSDELIETLMAATDPRTDMQCAGLCSDYPGTTPIPGSENMCRRPCGGRILNLANVPEPVGTTGVGD